MSLLNLLSTKLFNLLSSFLTMDIYLSIDDSHSVWFHVDSKISHKQNKIFSCETSFCQNPSWLLPGLRKMLFYTIYQTDRVLVNVYPKNLFWVKLNWLFHCTMTDVWVIMLLLIDIWQMLLSKWQSGRSQDGFWQKLVSQLKILFRLWEIFESTWIFMIYHCLVSIIIVC